MRTKTTFFFKKENCGTISVNIKIIDECTHNHQWLCWNEEREMTTNFAIGQVPDSSFGGEGWVRCAPSAVITSAPNISD